MGLKDRLTSWLFKDIAHEINATLQGIRDDIAALDSRIQDLNTKVEKQDEVLKRLILTLNKKVDKAELYHIRDELEKIRGEIKAINQELYDFGERVDAVELLVSSEAKGESLDDSEVERLVILYIKRGVTSPTMLREELGISWDKLYRALNSLIAKRVVKRVKKGRKVRYVLAGSE